MGSQRIGHNWKTELSWTEAKKSKNHWSGFFYIWNHWSCSFVSGCPKLCYIWGLRGHKLPLNTTIWTSYTTISFALPSFYLEKQTLPSQKWMLGKQVNLDVCKVVPPYDIKNSQGSCNACGKESQVKRLNISYPNWPQVNLLGSILGLTCRFKAKSVSPKVWELIKPT